MANRNGLGPLNKGAMTGNGLGNCGKGSNLGKIGLGIGAGVGFMMRHREKFRRNAGRNNNQMRGQGFRLNRRFWQDTEIDSKEELKVYKEQLQQELANVESELESK